ncbi:MAG: DNA gyrase C-terminal beta-propeller domain-containing protein, partial [Planctomycetota bacterium]
IIIRTGLEDIREIGRNTQGVRLIKLGSGDKLVAVEKIVVENVNNTEEKPNIISQAEPEEKKTKKGSNKK